MRFARSLAGLAVGIAVLLVITDSASALQDPSVHAVYRVRVRSQQWIRVWAVNDAKDNKGAVAGNCETGNCERLQPASNEQTSSDDSDASSSEVLLGV